jgi:hypothetical protein
VYLCNISFNELNNQDKYIVEKVCGDYFLAVSDKDKQKTGRKATGFENIIFKHINIR